MSYGLHPKRRYQIEQEAAKYEYSQLDQETDDVPKQKTTKISKS